MDLASRWDRVAVAILLFAMFPILVGCTALGSSPNAAQHGAVWASKPVLDFGTIAVGGSQTLTDFITNSTSHSVTLSLEQASAPDFRVSAPAFPLTLAPGQSVRVAISFAPHSAGQPSGKISFVNSSEKRMGADVAVAGNCLQAGQLTVHPQSLAFGNIPVGKTQSISAKVTNSGGTSVTLAQISVSRAEFTFTGLNLPATLAPGRSALMTVIFAPKKPGAVSANVALAGSVSLSTGTAQTGSSKPATAPTSLSIGVSGAGVTDGQVAVTPASLSFVNVPVGSSQQKAAALTNSGGSRVTVSQAVATGAGFGISGLSLPLTLDAGQTTNFSVTFTPKASGAATGSISFASNAPNGALGLALSGTTAAPGQVSANPANFSFGSVLVGNNQKQNGTLTNTGQSSLTISQAAATGTGFSMSGISLPLTLAAGQSASFSVIFAPQAGGSVTGNLAFATGSSTLNLPLAGAGLAAGSLSASPSSISLGSVPVGSQQSATVTLTNNGSSSVTLSQASASGSGFSLSGLSIPASLAAGQSVSFSVRFVPTAGGAASGMLSIASNASNPTLNLALSGTGATPGILSANATSLAFPGVPLGGSQTKSETITNSGGTSVTISQIAASGAGFSLGALTLPASLGAGQSLTVSITFAPQSAGNAIGNLNVTSNATNPNLSASLSGTVAPPGQLSVSPTPLSFGTVPVGTSKSLAETLTATSASVIVTSASSSSAEFVLSGLSLPLTLAAGQRATLTVTFTPQSTGGASGSISFAGNATNSPAVSASGTGAAAAQHKVALAWNASTSTVAGYNIYRGTQSGGPYVMVSSIPDASTTYADNSVDAGATYFYVVTAVDNGGTESAYSNEVRAVVSTP